MHGYGTSSREGPSLHIGEIPKRKGELWLYEQDGDRITTLARFKERAAAARCQRLLDLLILGRKLDD